MNTLKELPVTPDAVKFTRSRHSLERREKGAACPRRRARPPVKVAKLEITILSVTRHYWHFLASLGTWTNPFASRL